LQTDPAEMIERMASPTNPHGARRFRGQITAEKKQTDGRKK
jgi:hypothetical protein